MALKTVLALLVFGSAVPLGSTTMPAAAPLAQDEGYPWLNPPPAILLEYARRGFEGTASKPVELHKEMGGICQASVGSISLESPSMLAQTVGFDRDRGSLPAPVLDDLKGVTKAAKVTIVFGSRTQSEPVQMRFRQKWAKYKPKLVTEQPTQSVRCSGQEMWLRTAVLLFRGKKPLPKGGRGVFVLELSGGARFEIPVSFDGLR